MKKETTTKDLRQFGIVLGLILGVIGGIHYLKGHEHSYPWLFAAGAVSIMLGVLTPGVLKPAFTVFTKVAHAIGWFNTRVILALVYYILLTPIGLIMRLFGKDLLNVKIRKEEKSYWIRRPNTAATKETLERQF